MKTMSIKLNLEGIKLNQPNIMLCRECNKKHEPEHEEETPESVLLANIITLVTYSAMQRSRSQKSSLASQLPYHDRRRLDKMMSAIEVAQKAKKETVELEDDWYSFLERCMKETEMPGTMKITGRLFDLIEGVETK